MASNSRVFVWSDQHFFHKNIIKYTNRPFEFSDEGVNAQSRQLLKNYQELVQPHDLVVFFGDVAFCTKSKKPELAAIFAQMTGHKILLKGNHDSLTDSFYFGLGFEQIYPYLICGKYFLCHYPLQDPPSCKHEAAALEAFRNSDCSMIIHGHVHDQDAQVTDQVPRWNVCVDYGTNNYRPLLVEDPVLSQHLLGLVGEDGANTSAGRQPSLLDGLE